MKTEARAILVEVLEALRRRDLGRHMLWIGEDVVVDGPGIAPIGGRYEYLRLISPALLPRGPAELAAYNLSYLGSTSAGTDWMKVMHQFRVQRGGRGPGPECADLEEIRLLYGLSGRRIRRIRSEPWDVEWPAWLRA